MASDALYSLAFEYKEAKPWTGLWDTEMFAVALSDGQTGYISVMGQGKEYCAMALYVGQEGLDSWRDLMDSGRMVDPTLDIFDQRRIMLRQDSLQLALECKDALTDTELKEAQDYAARNGIRLSGKNAYPQFIKYKPFKNPWFNLTKQEEKLLAEAARCAIWVAGELKTKSLPDLGIAEFYPDSEEIVTFVPEGKGFKQTFTKLPERLQQEYPRPRIVNDLTIAKLRKLRRATEWECRLVLFPEPVQNGPNQQPYFPTILFAVESKSGFLMAPVPAPDYKKDAGEILKGFVNGLIEYGTCPAAIRVYDEWTYALMENLAERVGIRLSIEDDLPALEEAVEDFAEHAGLLDDAEQEADAFFEFIEQMVLMSDDELQSMPKELRGQLRAMSDMKDVPVEIRSKLRSILARLK